MSIYFPSNSCQCFHFNTPSRIMTHSCWLIRGSTNIGISFVTHSHACQNASPNLLLTQPHLPSYLSHPQPPACLYQHFSHRPYHPHLPLQPPPPPPPLPLQQMWSILAAVWIRFHRAVLVYVPPVLQTRIRYMCVCVFVCVYVRNNEFVPPDFWH